MATKRKELSDLVLACTEYCTHDEMVDAILYLVEKWRKRWLYSDRDDSKQENPSG